MMSEINGSNVVEMVNRYKDLYQQANGRPCTVDVVHGLIQVNGRGPWVNFSEFIEMTKNLEWVIEHKGRSLMEQMLSASESSLEELYEYEDSRIDWDNF